MLRKPAASPRRPWPSWSSSPHPEPRDVLQLSHRPTQLGPLQLGEDDILGRCDEQSQAVHMGQRAPIELDPAEGSGLPADEVDLPARNQIDHVELQFPLERLERGLLVGEVQGGGVGCESGPAPGPETVRSRSRCPGWHAGVLGRRWRRTRSACRESRRPPERRRCAGRGQRRSPQWCWQHGIRQGEPENLPLDFGLRPLGMLGPKPRSEQGSGGQTHLDGEFQPADSREAPQDAELEFGRSGRAIDHGSSAEQTPACCGDSGTR